MTNIKDLIDNSDLSTLQKNVAKGFWDRANAEDEKKKADKALILEIAKEEASKVLLSTDDVKIYLISGKGDWEMKYPYRVIYYSHGKWKRVDVVSPSLEFAFLYYLQYKQLGSNSQFAELASKMLDMSIYHK